MPTFRVYLTNIEIEVLRDQLLSFLDDTCCAVKALDELADAPLKHFGADPEILSDVGICQDILRKLECE